MIPAYLIEVHDSCGEIWMAQAFIKEGSTENAFNVVHEEATRLVAEVRAWRKTEDCIEEVRITKIKFEEE